MIFSDSSITDEKKWYNLVYNKNNYFSHKKWLFSPYMSSLLKRIGLTKGSVILDVGCGQGLFVYLLNKHGMRTYGIDISEVGLHGASENFLEVRGKLVVGDAGHLPFSKKFDCVFIRSCSLYNTKELEKMEYFTERFMDILKPNGVFVFIHNSNLKYIRMNNSFINHSIESLNWHFRKYKNCQIYFITKIDTIALGKFAFSGAITILNTIVSKKLGVGGDIVCMIKNSAAGIDSTNERIENGG